jgi:putative toxin-antitoxin system antitoxin component (TIGR02293 family)
MSGIALKVRDLGERAHLSQDDVGRIVGVAPRTVARWVAGDSTPQQSAKERLLELAYVAEQLIDVLGLTPDDANLWIFSPNRLLGGGKPSELIHDGHYRRVLDLIEALADGIVA